jgi:hypothetical protein
MLYKDLRLLVLSFLEYRAYSPLKKCFLLRRLAELSFDERGLAARITELDIIFRRAFIPNELCIRSAVNHGLVMDELYYGSDQYFFGHP